MRFSRASLLALEFQRAPPVSEHPVPQRGDHPQHHHQQAEEVPARAGGFDHLGRRLRASSEAQTPRVGAGADQSHQHPPSTSAARPPTRAFTQPARRHHGRAPV